MGNFGLNGGVPWLTDTDGVARITRRRYHKKTNEIISTGRSY